MTKKRQRALARRGWFEKEKAWEQSSDTKVFKVVNGKEVLVRVIPQKHACYYDYLNSKHWKKTRKNFLNKYGWQCKKCGRSQGVLVHHKNYNSVFNEDFNDLLPLCRDCHDKEHGKK